MRIHYLVRDDAGRHAEWEVCRPRDQPNCTLLTMPRAELITIEGWTNLSHAYTDHLLLPIDERNCVDDALLSNRHLDLDICDIFLGYLCLSEVVLIC